MKLINRIWNDIRQGENADLYLTIIVSLVVGIVGLFGLAKDQIAPLTLAVLALLAFSTLKNRYQAEELGNKLDARSGSSISLDDVFQNHSPVLQSRLDQAKSISHNGMSLVGTSNALLGTFSNCVGKGGQVRLIVIDPASPALHVAALRFNKHQDAPRLQREVEHALDNFRVLATPPKTNFQVHLAEAIPSYSIWLIDAGLPTAEIWVGLYPYRDELEPWLHLLPAKDGEMFSFFNKQFESMWNYSKNWVP